MRTLDAGQGERGTKIAKKRAGKKANGENPERRKGAMTGELIESLRTRVS